MTKFHPFHIVDSSPWPLLGSINVMSMIVLIYMSMNELIVSFVLFSVISSMILILYQWWRDVVRESSYMGMHSLVVKQGLYMGFIMFVLSEVMFFVSFFFGYFFISLSPDLEIGGWPPSGIMTISYMEVPLINTLLLLSSGVSITWSHHSIMEGNLSSCKMGLILTLFLGVTFSVFQLFEYVDISFSICDSVYGSLFFIITGFHGIHVLVGSIFIMVGLVRLSKFHYSNSQHLGLEASIWYWHFVDVVWLFVYIFVYWWGF